MISFKKKQSNNIEHQLSDKSLKLKLFRKRLLNAKINKDNEKLKMLAKSHTKNPSQTNQYQTEEIQNEGNQLDTYKLHIHEPNHYKKKKSDLDKNSPNLAFQNINENNISITIQNQDIPEFSIHSVQNCCLSEMRYQDFANLNGSIGEFDKSKSQLNIFGQNQQNVSQEMSMLNEDYLDQLYEGSIDIDVDKIIKEVDHDTKMRRGTSNSKVNSRKCSEDFVNESETKQKDVIVLHRLNYFNKVDFDTKNIHISKDLLKYLLSSYEEWSIGQRDYQKWFNNQKKEIIRNGVKESEALQLLLSKEVPSMEIKIPMDMSESNTGLSED